jgi:hypothetical protein
VAGGIGTTFFSTKIGVLNNEAHGLKLAVAPTLEILSKASGPVGQSRTQWGLPVSVELDRKGDAFTGARDIFHRAYGTRAPASASP